MEIAKAFPLIRIMYRIYSHISRPEYNPATWVWSVPALELPSRAASRVDSKAPYPRSQHSEPSSRRRAESKKKRFWTNLKVETYGRQGIHKPKGVQLSGIWMTGLLSGIWMTDFCRASECSNHLNTPDYSSIWMIDWCEMVQCSNGGLKTGLKKDC